MTYEQKYLPRASNTSTWALDPATIRSGVQHGAIAERHIRGLIRERTAKEVRHGRRFQRVPIHVAANDSPDGLCVEHAPLPSRESSSAAFVGLVFRLASELKRITHGDANAQKVLGCWHAGIVERDAVVARTGLTLAAYKATRKRLFSFSKRLSPELGESTRDVLRSAS